MEPANRPDSLIPLPFRQPVLQVCKYIIVSFCVTFSVCLLVKGCNKYVDSMSNSLTNRTQIKCYECVVIRGLDSIPDVGLPFEDKCETDPQNYRVCDNGDLCSTARVTFNDNSNVTRFHRSCYTGYLRVPYGKRVCHTKPMGVVTMGEWCQCRGDFCL